MMETLDVQCFELHGQRLIEASAGTGKTYTIANLYLRLVLGHEQPKPLTVDQILVVTFTDAATAELKDRIRKRLQEARFALRAGESTDPFISFLISALDRQHDRIQLLLAAEQQMDEAAVFTIHGFSHRILKQHAFESGTLFTSELMTDENPLLIQTTADFWRTHFYTLNKPVARIARSIWKTPQDLLNSLKSLLSKVDLKLIDHHIPQSLTDFLHTYVEPAIVIRDLWKSERQQIEDQVTDAHFRKNAIPLKRLVKMADFAESDALYPTLEKSESWEVYANESLQKGLKKGGTCPDHRVFELIDQQAALPMTAKAAFKNMIMILALRDIEARKTRHKREHHQLSFNDLLTQLRKALTSHTGERLAQAIRAQFPIAMIDEFQDTDPIQYDIFSTIYRNHTDTTLEKSKPETGLFMIGDPKQAIYGFRGADIFTYLKAKSQVATHYSLDTNWRSTHTMVSSVNHLFSVSQKPFIYEQIPFIPVAPSPMAQKKKLLVNGVETPALNLWLEENDGQSVNADHYQDVMTQATVTQIHKLLSEANKGECHIHSSDTQRPLQAGDIAILVRKGREADRVRKALSDNNIASVYMSSGDSVFASAEASDLLRLLSACLNPTNDRTLRSALGTALLNLTATELDDLNENEQAWETAVEQFTGFHQIWLNQGVLPMLRTVMLEHRVAEKLLAEPYGERRLTDLLHLGELLMSASNGLETPHALLHWYGQQVQAPDANADSQQLQLETERNLVQIVTIHKSKGLEYPVVFLPFVCNYREADTPVFSKDGQTILDLSGDKAALEAADRERLAEDLRLLYVALTRSVYACYLGLAPIKKRSVSDQTELHKTSIGWLLSTGEPLSVDDFYREVQRLAGDHDFITLKTPPVNPDLPDYTLPTETPTALSARTFTGSIEKNWWVTSYSALSKSSHHTQTTHNAAPSPDASSEDGRLDMEVHNEASDASSQPDASVQTAPTEDEELTIFTFPKGARAGTFLHTLLEEYPSASRCRRDVFDFVKEQLLKEGFDEKWHGTLMNMLDHCLNCPLDGRNMTLAELPAAAQKAEMEFYMPVNRLRASALNALLASEDPLSRQAGELSFATVKGMLKGFIDLTFEYQGRWYVLDYKSNWLGPTLDDYQQSPMQRVMVKHRYDLQYQIYSLALHRLLKNRLPGYCYEKHFGGVFYLFLRGIRKESSEHGVFHHRPSQKLINKLDTLFSGGPEC